MPAALSKRAVMPVTLSHPVSGQGAHALLRKHGSRSSICSKHRRAPHCRRVAVYIRLSLSHWHQIGFRGTAAWAGCLQRDCNTADATFLGLEFIGLASVKKRRVEPLPGDTTCSGPPHSAISSAKVAQRKPLDEEF